MGLDLNEHPNLIFDIPPKSSVKYEKPHSDSVVGQ